MVRGTDGKVYPATNGRFVEATAPWIDAGIFPYRARKMGAPAHAWGYR